MTRYILQRLAITLPLLLAISVVTFTFINVAPGDPITAMISPEDQLNAEDLDRLRRNLGLDQPLPVRYVLWLGQAVQGNFGYSYITKEPVLQRIWARFGPTLELMGVALLVSTVFGVLFGILAAIRVYTFWDYFLTVLSLFGLSVPGFFFALVALYLFAAKLQVLPAFGMQSGTGPFSLADNLYHLILPAGVLSLELMASLTRYARAAMLEVLRSDYVTTARAKGLSEAAVIGRHAFRNALIPLITIAALRVPYLVGGAIIIETMFQWPGMGLLSIQAIQQRDYPVLMGLTFMISVLVLASNLLADVLYAYADPRIRYG
jgi:peptide/nickel transport system permease protein